MPRVIHDASEFLDQHPHPAFTRIRDKGFTIHYEHDEGSHWIEVMVRKGEVQVAKCDFCENEFFVYSQHPDVLPEYKRHGLGTAMYVFAEKFFGKKMGRLWEEKDQTSEAQAFWNQPNRPFG